MGTAALTSLGMGEKEMQEIASIVKLIVSGTSAKTLETGKNAGKPSKIAYSIKSEVKQEASTRVKTLLDRFPLYPELDLEFLQSQFCK
jgi:glycine hydroxymethyltransferase